MNRNNIYEQLKIDEGVVYEIYKDHLGYPTFGVGHLILKTDDEFENILNFYNPFKIFKKKHLNFKRIFFSFSLKSEKEKLEFFLKKNMSIFDLKNELLNFTKKNLSTEELAKYTIKSFKE